MTTLFVYQVPRIGTRRHIKLAGTDLWITGLINNLFVYPSGWDVVKFKDALSRTLFSWPFIAGRFLGYDGEHYLIEMSDNAIPVFVIENTDLTKWPLDSNVVVDKNSQQLQQFLDEVQTTILISDSCRDEPLFRLKLTHIKQSGEWIMGASWSHMLGDADAFLQFLKTISHLYQNLEAPKPIPIFNRHVWLHDEADESLRPDIKKFLDGEQMETNDRKDPAKYDQVNIHFRGEQLKELHSLIGDRRVTIQDALCAYIILTLNTHCAQNNDELILRTNIMINYRKESNPDAQPGLIANAVLMPLSNFFEDPKSLSSIAKTIRKTIDQSRDIEFIRRWVATADKVMRTIVRNKGLPKMSISNDRIVLNSNWRYDWANLVDFGHKNKCRFYTTWTRALYLRIFRLNPIYNDTQWIGRDEDGAEVAFRIEENKKQKFIDACKNDISESFINVKR
ncbi:unnamed protein product [Rotaria sp. Silwood1]|nr:unnamed protein product [Rotaria sp. Silwood1]CAF1653164.1 unnamed protein product [Rotaria sp. Silwood1]